MSQQEDAPVDTVYSPERFHNDFKGEVALLRAQTALFWAAEQQHLCQYFNLSNDSSRIVDLGCGVGTFLEQVLDDFPRTQCAGLDINQKFIDYATRSHRHFIEEGRLTYNCGSVYDTGFEDASFDFVIMRFVVQHLVEPARAFAEISRILKPGGQLVLATSSNNFDVMDPPITELQLLWQGLWQAQADWALELKQQVDDEPGSTTQQDGKDGNITIFGPAIHTHLETLGYTNVQTWDIEVDSLDIGSLTPFLPLMTPRQFAHLVVKGKVSQEVYDSAVSQFDVLLERQQKDPSALRYRAYQCMVGGTKPLRS